MQCIIRLSKNLPLNLYSEIWIEANLVILKLPILLWSIEEEDLEIIFLHLWYYYLQKKTTAKNGRYNGIIYDNL